MMHRPHRATAAASLTSPPHCSVLLICRYEANLHGKADKDVFSTLMPEGTDLAAIAKQKDDLFVEVYM